MSGLKCPMSAAVSFVVGSNMATDSREHASGKAYRRVHADPEHDDRCADADRDGHPRLDHQAGMGRHRLESHLARRAFSPTRTAGEQGPLASRMANPQPSLTAA